MNRTEFNKITDLLQECISCAPSELTQHLRAEFEGYRAKHERTYNSLCQSPAMRKVFRAIVEGCEESWEMDR